ncbi:hypothetical protein ANCCEY_04103 [Ancylostoma ceylanicum]|uniref:Uncharacterized protein n=1 Tax=Ancylostoma ceylanicum TaxID=53326 RepID=A0A0D6M3C8_9BILA|nr:hypothetical protein ANCCEY_04103 [Ancylostoma ceylanicum]
MATRRRYGTYGRAVTLPAPVLSPTGDWPRATELPWRFNIGICFILYQVAREADSQAAITVHPLATLPQKSMESCEIDINDEYLTGIRESKIKIKLCKDHEITVPLSDPLIALHKAECDMGVGANARWAGLSATRDEAYVLAGWGALAVPALPVLLGMRERKRDDLLALSSWRETDRQNFEGKYVDDEQTGIHPRDFPHPILRLHHSSIQRHHREFQSLHLFSDTATSFVRPVTTCVPLPVNIDLERIVDSRSNAMHHPGLPLDPQKQTISREYFGLHSERIHFAEMTLHRFLRPAYVQPPTTIQAPPVLPIESPSRRIEARMRQRMINERLRAVHVPIAGDDGKSSIQELMDRYLNKSRESVVRTSPPPSPTKKEADPDEIRRLLDRYASPGVGGRTELETDPTSHKPEEDHHEAQDSSEQPHQPTTDSSADGRIRWRTDVKQKNTESSKKIANSSKGIDNMYFLDGKGIDMPAQESA